MAVEVDEIMSSKISHNKTCMVHKHLEAPPYVGSSQSNRFGRIIGIFKGTSSKKEFAENDIKSESETLQGISTKQQQEPDFLKEIDLGHHKNMAEPELALWINDGRAVRSLDELGKALKTMSNRTYNQHYKKGDVSQWVHDVIGKPDIANELSNAKNKKHAWNIIQNHKNMQNQRQAEPKTDSGQAEIQKAIEKVVKPAKDTNLDPADKEKSLIEMERLIEVEEESINKKRKELADKRYQLLIERGKIEKEKFEDFFNNYGEENYQTNAKGPKTAILGLELTPKYTNDRILELLAQARSNLDRGNIQDAQKINAELKLATEFADITPDMMKRIEYDMLSLEADLKLATLV